MRITVFGIALVLFCISCATAQESVDPPTAIAKTTIDEEKKTRIDRQLIVISALVEKVDVEKRLLKIKDSEGIIETVRVDLAVKRLAEIKKGDTISLSYYESVAFEIREPTAEEKENPGVLFGGAGVKGKESAPGAGAVVMAHAITTIEKIDKEAAVVTLKGPQGNTAKVKAKDPKNLEKLNIGDTVAVTITEALAVEIEPGK